MLLDEVAKSRDLWVHSSRHERSPFIHKHIFLRRREFIQLDLSMLNFYWLIFTDSHILLVYYFSLTNYDITKLQSPIHSDFIYSPIVFCSRRTRWQSRTAVGSSKASVGLLPQLTSRRCRRNGRAAWPSILGLLKRQVAKNCRLQTRRSGLVWQIWKLCRNRSNWTWCQKWPRTIW